MTLRHLKYFLFAKGFTFKKASESGLLEFPKGIQKLLADSFVRALHWKIFIPAARCDVVKKPLNYHPGYNAIVVWVGLLWPFPIEFGAQTPLSKWLHYQSRLFSNFFQDHSNPISFANVLILDMIMACSTTKLVQHFCLHYCEASFIVCEMGWHSSSSPSPHRKYHHILLSGLTFKPTGWLWTFVF